MAVVVPLVDVVDSVTVVVVAVVAAVVVVSFFKSSRLHACRVKLVDGSKPSQLPRSLYMLPYSRRNY